MTKLELSKLSASELAALIGRDDLAILAGSGISIWSPSDLPTGMQFTQGIFDALFRIPGLARLTAKDESFLESWFKFGLAGPGSSRHLSFSAIPFEVVMERCVRHDALAPLIGQIYACDRANPVHEALAALVAAGRAAAIVTTNYDCGLETALGRGTLARVVRESDAPGHGNVYFKIHGTTGVGFEDTLVYRLRAEGALPIWKRHVLRQVVQGRVLVVLGYSGVDFDICPMLGMFPPRLVLWNFLTEEDGERSPGLRRLNSAGVVTVQLIGDMTRLLGLLTGNRVDAVRASVAVPIAELLSARLSPVELLLWRSRVLNSMGHARLAEAALATISGPPGSEFELRQSRAQALFHAGAYSRSSAEFRSAATVAHDDRQRRLSLLDASDASRCLGRTRQARMLIEQAVAGLSDGVPSAEEVRATADLKRILLLRDRYELASVLSTPGQRKRLRRLAEPLVTRVARSALESGRWFEFQQVSFWAERLGISTVHATPTALYASPPAQMGYRQLGYPVAAAMEACDRARRKEASVEELEWLLALMVDFGANPQAWKSAYAITRSYPEVALRHLATFGRAFARCEYTALSRLLWLLKGS